MVYLSVDIIKWKVCSCYITVFIALIVGSFRTLCCHIKHSTGVSPYVSLVSIWLVNSMTSRILGDSFPTLLQNMRRFEEDLLSYRIDEWYISDRQIDFNPRKMCCHVLCQNWIRALSWLCCYLCVACQQGWQYLCVLFTVLEFFFSTTTFSHNPSNYLHARCRPKRKYTAKK